MKALSAKFKAATESLQHTKVAFDDLNSDIQPETREKWMNSEQIALEFRGEYLKIYDIQLEKSKFLYTSEPEIEIWNCEYEAPSLADIRLALSAREKATGLPSGIISFMTQGMDLEWTQWVTYRLQPNREAY